jgi:hypothetical protein
MTMQDIRMDPARFDQPKSDRTGAAALESGLGAWASAISADDNAQAAIALAEAINRARTSEAGRENRAADARVIAVGRLETLRARLAPIYAAIPRDVELFDLGMVGHSPPRLFVDIIAFIEMADGAKSFRLMQETRSGRILLGETGDERQMAALVTDYIAERLVERERALATRGVHGRPQPLPKTQPLPMAAQPAPPDADAGPGAADGTSASSPAAAGVVHPARTSPAAGDAAAGVIAHAPPGAGLASSPPGAGFASSPPAAQIGSVARQAGLSAGASAAAGAGAGRHDGGGWFWPLLALCVGIGIGALLLYLYAASLARP